MSEGRLLAIHICGHAGQPLQPVDAVVARSGVGLDGDRYALGQGTWTPTGGRQRQLSLIESEALAAMALEGTTLAPADSRRNLLTVGVALNELVGRVFRIGGVPMRGVKLCPPCGYLQRRTQPGMVQALSHRGGLYAEILEDGVLQVGDVIEVEPVAAGAGMAR